MKLVLDIFAKLSVAIMYVVGGVLAVLLTFALPVAYSLLAQLIIVAAIGIPLFVFWNFLAPLYLSNVLPHELLALPFKHIIAFVWLSISLRAVILGAGNVSAPRAMIKKENA